MAHSFLIFDFGSNEEAAQQARHKVEGWKQGFRLGNKLMVKFDRGDEKAAEKDAKAEGAKKDAVLLMVRLDFSDHEKLSHQRWLDRIPAEALFRDAKPKIVRQGDQEFTSASERFEALG
jgi:nicotinic acid phosphoribosyltransferase